MKERDEDVVMDTLIAELEVAARAMAAPDEYDDCAPCPECGQPGPGDRVWEDDDA